ncbi:MAG TPA: LuxR C-terminal-related transcriptional regulator [Chloroflexota bacterium]|nr:LuxR C-terminal-related transcriptional regulator [Chloroflexota bacterium]
MQAPISLTIIRSTHPGWPHVRAVLAAQAQIDIVADIETERLNDLGAARPSDVILAAADLGEYHPVALQEVIRTIRPDSALIFLGSMADLEGAALLVLHEHGLRGYLVWEEVRPTTVAQAIIAIQTRDLLVASPAVSAIFRAALERRQRPRVAGLVLTPGERRMWVNPTTGRPLVLSTRDQAVLRHLLHGLKQQQIAQAEKISVRTVESHIARLKEQFGVEKSAMLGVLAERWGIVQE